MFFPMLNTIILTAQKLLSERNTTNRECDYFALARSRRSNARLVKDKAAIAIKT
jgi:hypothetical protein